jgi:hypothetical protein
VLRDLLTSIWTQLSFKHGRQGVSDGRVSFRGRELRTIFLFEADHVLISSGSAKAEAFIGFRTEDEYCHESPTKVDLSLFAGITGSFERGYEYAFNPSLLNTFQEHEIQDLHTFLQGTPRIGAPHLAKHIGS